VIRGCRLMFLGFIGDCWIFVGNLMLCFVL
jgi:hypothetical protein